MSLMYPNKDLVSTGSNKAPVQRVSARAPVASALKQLVLIRPLLSLIIKEL